MSNVKGSFTDLFETIIRYNFIMAYMPTNLVKTFNPVLRYPIMLLALLNTLLQFALNDLL